MAGATVTAHGALKAGFRRRRPDPRPATRPLTFAEAPTGWQASDELVVAGMAPSGTRTRK